MNNILRKPFRYSYNNYLLIIIIINFAVFMITYFRPNAIAYLALRPVTILKANSYWQFVTYMFTHGGFSHIFFNMLGLFFFGFPVEKTMGSKEFLLFYFFCGIGAGVFSYFYYLFSGGINVFLIGASGVVYAVLLAFAVYYPRSIIYVMGFIPLRATWVVVIYTVIELFSQLGGRGSNIAHLTHLAGFAFAYIYFQIRLGINPIKELFGRR